MTDATIGHMIQRDITAIPRSALLYACAGLAGAIGITAIELATKIDAPLPSLVQPVTQKSAPMSPPASLSPDQPSINKIDPPMAAIAFRDGLAQLRKQMAAQATPHIFALPQRQDAPTGAKPARVFAETSDEPKLTALRVGIPAAMIMTGSATFGQASGGPIVGGAVAEPRDKRILDQKRDAPVDSQFRQYVPTFAPVQQGRAVAGPG